MFRVILCLVFTAFLSACGSGEAAILAQSPTTGSYTTVTDLYTAASSPSYANKTIVVTSALSAVQSNISSATVHQWPSDRALRVEKGGSIGNTTLFRFADGTTVDFPSNAQVFTGTGSIVFGYGATDKILPEWFYSGSGGWEVAINKAITVQRASVQTVVGMSTAGSVIPIRLHPNKKYIIDDSITGGDYLSIHGDGSAICTSAAYPFTQTYDLITDIGYDPRISGIHFFGGINVLVFPENAQGFDIFIDNCKFQEWSGTAIKGSTVPHAQNLVVGNSLFYPRETTSVIAEIAFDRAEFKNCQINGYSDTFFINHDNLTIAGMAGSPIKGATTPVTWIENRGIRLTLDNCRFGGESGTRTIVDNYTASGGNNPTSIVIQNNEMYSTGYPVVRFYDIPDHFAFKNNNGMVGSYPFYFDSAIPQTTLDVIGKRTFEIVGGTFSEIMGSIDSSESAVSAIKSSLAQNLYNHEGTRTILTSSKISDLLYTDLSGALSPSCTAGTSTDVFGATTQTITGADVTLGSNYFYTQNSTLMTGKSAGVYTVVVNCNIVNGIIRFSINAGGAVKNVNLGPGDHTISFPFYFDGTNVPAVGYQAYNINATTVFHHGGLRLFLGNVKVDTWQSITYANAAPVAGYHRLGDRVIRLTPVVGQPKGWVCTVAGTPGTWVSEGNQ